MFQQRVFVAAQCLTLMILVSWESFGAATAEVLRWDKEKITVASDSQGTSVSSGFLPHGGEIRYDECKMGTLDDKSFFAVSGDASWNIEGPTGLKLAFDSRSVARQAFENAKRGRTSTRNILDVARSWGRLAANKYNSIPVDYRKTFVTQGKFQGAMVVFAG